MKKTRVDGVMYDDDTGHVWIRKYKGGWRHCKNCKVVLSMAGGFDNQPRYIRNSPCPHKKVEAPQ